MEPIPPIANVALPSPTVVEPIVSAVEPIVSQIAAPAVAEVVSSNAEPVAATVADPTPSRVAQIAKPTDAPQIARTAVETIAASVAPPDVREPINPQIAAPAADEVIGLGAESVVATVAESIPAPVAAIATTIIAPVEQGPVEPIVEPLAEQVGTIVKPLIEKDPIELVADSVGAQGVDGILQPLVDGTVGPVVDPALDEVLNSPSRVFDAPKPTIGQPLGLGPSGQPTMPAQGPKVGSGGSAVEAIETSPADLADQADGVADHAQAPTHQDAFTLGGDSNSEHSQAAFEPALPATQTTPSIAQPVEPQNWRGPGRSIGATHEPAPNELAQVTRAAQSTSLDVAGILADARSGAIDRSNWIPILDARRLRLQDDDASAPGLGSAERHPSTFTGHPDFLQLQPAIAPRFEASPVQQQPQTPNAGNPIERLMLPPLGGVGSSPVSGGLSTSSSGPSGAAPTLLSALALQENWRSLWQSAFLRPPDVALPNLAPPG